MTVTTYEVEQGSQEWLDLRRGLVTASTIGKLITPKTIKVASNDESRGLIAALVAERITGWSDPSYFNADMQRGHDIEPIARDWYAEKYGAKVAEVGFMVREIGDGLRTGYSPDGLVGDDGLIEVKAPRAKAHLLTHVAGDMPLAHMAQVQTGLFVSGRQWVDFISFYAGMPPFVKRIEADDRWFDAIAEAVETFETKAAEMQAEYETKTNGLPTTERLAYDLEVVIYMDVTDAIAPKSDQMNAEDLLTGPRTFTIAEVRQGDEAKPVWIYLDPFDSRRPLKPSKTVLRIFVAAWGKEAQEWVGKRVTLFRDPDVKWAGSAVGGIRVQAMSHIDKPLSLSLTETRGTRRAHKIQPLTADAPKPSEPTAEQVAACTIEATLRDWWKTSSPERRAQIEARVAELQKPADEPEDGLNFPEATDG